MKPPEFWVMRVLMHQGPDGVARAVTLDNMTTGAQVGVVGALAAGALCLLPDGTIAEPTEVFDDQEVAHRHRAKLCREFPREDFRVVLNADAIGD